MKTFDITKIPLKIQAPGIEIDDDLYNYFLSQIEKLGKTYARIETCEIMMRDEKDSGKQNSWIEVKVYIPGKVLFATEKSDNFRLAAKTVFDDVYRQLYKFKEKSMDRTQVEEEINGETTTEEF